jgi:hypothetical protein
LQSDPVQVLRALAHPLRLRLLQLAAAEGVVTSTTASRTTGESTANCSFHLRLLAKYGFLEQGAAGDRREKPWQVAENPPLAEIWQLLDVRGRSVTPLRPAVIRGQLRIFDPDRLPLAA